MMTLVSSNALSGLFELVADHVECVLLNSCYSSMQAEEINKHIKYVIGMGNAVPDKAALEFSIGFYDALGAGKTVPQAFKFGCNAIEMYGIPEDSAPVLKVKSQVNDNQEQTPNFLFTGIYEQNNTDFLKHELTYAVQSLILHAVYLLNVLHPPDTG